MRRAAFCLLLLSCTAPAPPEVFYRMDPEDDASVLVRVTPLNACGVGVPAEYTRVTAPRGVEFWASPHARKAFERP